LEPDQQVSRSATQPCTSHCAAESDNIPRRQSFVYVSCVSRILKAAVVQKRKIISDINKRYFMRREISNVFKAAATYKTSTVISDCVEISGKILGHLP